MRAWISGYFGQGNVGDEAILAAVLQHAPQNVAAMILTPRNAKVLEGTHLVKACLEPPFDVCRGRIGLWYGVGYWLRHGHRIAQDIPRRKACVIAGGGWINDHVIGRALIKRKRLLALKNWNCRIGLLGIGVDRMTNTDDREAARRMVQDDVPYCSVRDAASADALSDLGVYRGRYHVGADLAFALRLPTMPHTRERLDSLSHAVVGLNLRPLFDAAKERGDQKRERHNRYRATCKTLVAMLMHRVRELVLLPFNPADVRFLEEVGVNCGLRVARLEDDPLRMAIGLRQFDAVVAMRYHAAVLALIQGIPFVPVPYASKLIALADECGIESADLIVGDGVLVKDQPLSPGAVISCLESVWTHRHELLPRWAALCETKAAIAREDMCRCWEILTE